MRVRLGFDVLKTGRARRGRENRGTAGVFTSQGKEIAEAIRNRAYEPMPVRRKGIPKPSGGSGSLLQTSVTHIFASSSQYKEMNS